MIVQLAVVGLLALQSGTQAILPPRDAPSGCRFGEVYKAEGWSIPGVPSPSTHMPASAASTIGAGGVRVESVKPKQRDVVVTYVECVPGEAARLRLVTAPFDVLSVSRVAIGTRVFAYEVALGEVVIEGGRRLHIGSAVIYYYYDPDGSGVFRVMQGVGAPGSYSYPVPAWIKSAERPIRVAFGDVIDQFAQYEETLVETGVEIAKGANGVCVAPPGASAAGCRAELTFSALHLVSQQPGLRDLLDAGQVVPLVVLGRVVLDSPSAPQSGKSFRPQFIVERVVEVGTPRAR